MCPLTGDFFLNLLCTVLFVVHIKHKYFVLVAMILIHLSFVLKINYLPSHVFKCSNYGDYIKASHSYYVLDVSCAEQKLYKTLLKMYKILLKMYKRLIKVILLDYYENVCIKL